MSDLINGIWQNAPPWVWPLFVVLLYLGFSAMRTRSSSVVPYYFYPFIGLTTLSGIGGLAHAPLNWVVFIAGYGLGMWRAFLWQDRLVLEKQGRQMQVLGERITMVILMATFFSNFVNGFLGVVAPEVQASLRFVIAFAAIIGACSGSFTGRALKVITLGDRGGAAPVG